MGCLVAYLSLSGLDKQSSAKQVQALTLCLSRETLTVVDNLGLTAAQRGNAGHVIDAMTRYVDGQVNESVERRNFRQRTQQPGETFDHFIVALRELAKTCQFCSEDCSQKSIRNQIIEGLLDGDTVEARERHNIGNNCYKVQGPRSRYKRQRAVQLNSTEAIAALRHIGSAEKTSTQLRNCPGCGSGYHQGGRK